MTCKSSIVSALPMTRRRRWLVAVLAMVALASVACGDEAGSDDEPSDIAVTDVAIVLPAGANSAIYFTVTNSGGGSDRLIEARTPVGETSLHETQLADGLMTMYFLESVPVAAGETVAFQPGGLHVMVHHVEPLVEHDEVEVELVFEKAGVVAVEAVVRTADALIEG